MKKRKITVGLIVLASLLGGLLLWYGNLGSLFHDRNYTRESTQTSSPDVPSNDQNADAVNGVQQFKKASIPKEVSETETADISSQIPPSPPLPKVSAKSTQPERKEAFGLKNSVDFIVRNDEPFEVAGEKLTIDELQHRLRPDSNREHVMRPISEVDVGSSIRKPIAAGKSDDAKSSSYYAVRVVKPGENLWNIHFAIIQEYLSRRHIILAAKSDEPEPDGQSSGIGRLLKFIEGVVFVYNVHQNRIETDLNLIHPYEIVVFFKISDLFAALDQLQPEDLQRLRFVSNYLQVQRPGSTADLLDRRTLRAY